MSAFDAPRPRSAPVRELTHDPRPGGAPVSGAETRSGSWEPLFRPAFWARMIQVDVGVVSSAPLF